LSLIRDLYLRFQILIHEIGKFGLVGIVGTIVTISIQNALYKPHGFWLEGSVVIATAIATVVTFLGNRYWAFKHRRTDNLPRETVLFVIFNVLGLLIQVAAVSINAHWLDNQSRLAYNIANVIGIIIATLFRLFCYRTFVFRAVPGAAAAEELSEPVTIP
jgi:putative flippase GtrA